MKKFKNIFLLFIASSIFLISGCKKNQSKNAKNDSETNNQAEIEIKQGNHTWYCFTDQTFKQVSKPQNADMLPQLPWTEAVRISSANSVNSEDGGDARSFAIVNRLGVLCFENEKISIGKDISLFADRTAGNLVFLNNTPFFSVYKSSFFNDTITEPNYKNNPENHIFLVQFDDTAKISYPLINCNNICDAPNAEVTDFVWDGLNFICSVKSITDIKNSFSYISFKPNVPLLTLSPATSKENLIVTEANVEDFRKTKAQISYELVPERIKSLLKGFSSNLPFTIEVKTAGGTSPRIYQNAIPNSSEKELQAKAILAQSWAAALFEDGTLFIEGALPGKHILRGGKAVAIRLPKLPANFVYSDFVISGTTLYAAWEESFFYKTGRSGFLQVNLDKTLYSRIL